MNKFTLLLFLTINLFNSCKKEETKNGGQFVEKKLTKKLNQIDGPFIYDQKDSLNIITVDQEENEYYIVNRLIKKAAANTFTCKVNNSDKDSFSFTLKNKHQIPKAIYPHPSKIFVTSDIEGNFNAFYSMLIGNKVMNENYEWTFGNGHLVIAGDMVDRGNNTWPCLWLLYKLEHDAEIKGGKVHYILGNHDVMNMHANLKYVNNRHIELAKIISGNKNEKEAWLELLSDNNIIAQWIASKNTIEKIGDDIYVHGGISADVVDAGLTIEKINKIVRKNIRTNLTSNSGDNKLENLVFSNKGPLWYRGLVNGYKKYYKKIDSKNLDQILHFYKANHIIIGHTIVDKEITSGFNGRVIRVDIKHSTEKFTGKSQGLIIENNHYYKVSDNGNRYKLFN
jgi:hypothetical protein